MILKYFKHHLISTRDVKSAHDAAQFIVKKHLFTHYFNNNVEQNFDDIRKLLIRNQPYYLGMTAYVYYKKALYEIDCNELSRKERQILITICDLYEQSYKLEKSMKMCEVLIAGLAKLTNAVR